MFVICNKLNKPLTSGVIVFMAPPAAIVNPGPLP